MANEHIGSAQLGKLAVYPGTFDPLTNGHVSLILRGLKLFDSIVVAVAKDTVKGTVFSLEERLDLTRQALAGHDRVSVEPFSGLLVDYAEARGAHVILRGLRAVSDFEYEFQLALMNRKLKRKIETLFLMTDYRWLYISSTIIKDVARNGGDVTDLVPEAVRKALRGRFGCGE